MLGWAGLRGWATKHQMTPGFHPPEGWGCQGLTASLGCFLQLRAQTTKGGGGRGGKLRLKAEPQRGTQSSPVHDVAPPFSAPQNQEEKPSCKKGMLGLQGAPQMFAPAAGQTTSVLGLNSREGARLASTQHRCDPQLPIGSTEHHQE